MIHCTIIQGAQTVAGQNFARGGRNGLSTTTTTTTTTYLL